MSIGSDRVENHIDFIIDAMDMLYDWEINHYLSTSWDILPAPLDFRDFAYHLNFTVYDRKTIPDTFISAARHMLSLHEQGYEAKWWDMWCFTNRTAMAYPRFHLPGNLFNDDDIRLRFRRDDGSIEVEGLGDVLSKVSQAKSNPRLWSCKCTNLILNICSW